MKYASTGIVSAIVLGILSTCAVIEAGDKPNIVIVVAMDLGWDDTGYNGNTVVQTPSLDGMADEGIQFDYFYPGQQTGAGGQFAILSGRNPMRDGLHATGAARPDEIILPRALKQAGYKSGFFGSWQLGKDKSGPLGVGFDQAVLLPDGASNLDVKLQVNNGRTLLQTQGDSSIAIMDQAMGYINKQASASEPFFVLVNFGAVHAPWTPAAEFKNLYKDVTGEIRDYYGEVSGMDAALGNLRAELRRLSIADETIVWFTSANPAMRRPGLNDPGERDGSTVGTRVSGILEWPSRIMQHLKTSVVAGHVDMYPTVLEIAGVKVGKQPVLDGISLVPLIAGKMTERPKPIGFMQWNDTSTIKMPLSLAKVDFIKDTHGVWIDGKYKLIVGGGTLPNPNGGGPLLYDIYADPAQKANLADKEPERVQKMRQALDEWRTSVRSSFDGKDIKKP